ncbi:MAG: inositol monophosphatase [Gammaproteobacteria bacterium]|nr:inositol monophosphatase [Gammaproteobacteria bacterium]
MEILKSHDIKEFAIQVAQGAGDLIRKYRSEADLIHEFKQGTELVTNADLAVDKYICELIGQRFPDHLIVSEESSPDSAQLQDRQKALWIIDPIDGTVNFAHGHDQSAVSIAFVNQGDVTVGVVFNPFTNELFTAHKGGGAFLNGIPIQVAVQSQLNRAIIATGFPYEKSNLEPMIKRVRAVLTHCADIRRLGSAALDICWVAAGRLDGYYESLSLWDFAAARLIAIEAGAKCGHFSEVPEGVDPQFYDQDLLITNEILYPQLLTVLQMAQSDEIS